MQYRKLIRQYGRAAVSGALTQATPSSENEPNDVVTVRGWTSGWCASTAANRRSTRRIPPCSPPTTFPLSCSLGCSPGWKALALNPVGNTEFVAEVRRTVEPRYVWDPRPHYRYVEPLARTLLLQEREHDATSAGRRGEYDVLELSSRPGEAMNEPYRRS